MEKKKMYEIKGKTTSIAADIKITFKIRDNYFSVVAHEERALPQEGEIDMEREWEDLWDSVYIECEDQNSILKSSFKHKK